jgi:predicted MFS family arabinose efflux permease
MVSWAVVSRLPTGVATLLLALYMVGEGFSGSALGLVVASRTVAAAVCSPWLGRMVDRGFARPVLVVTAWLHLVMLTLLLLGILWQWPVVVLVILSLLWGVGSPPNHGITRPIWPKLVGQDLLPVAYSLEVLIVDVMYVGGPLIATGVAIAAGPGLGMWVTGVGVAIGTTMLAFTPAVREHTPKALPRALRKAGLASPPEPLFRTWAPVAVLAIGGCLLGFSLWTEVTIPLQMAELGLPQISGVLIAVWSVGSIIGVLAFLRFQPKWSLWTQLAFFLGIYLIPTGLLFFAGTSVWLYGAVLFFVGMLVSPCTNIQMQLGHRVAPESRQAEMFTWMGTASQIGSSIGSILAGLASDALPTSLAVGLAGSFVVLGFVIALVMRFVERTRLPLPDETAEDLTANPEPLR